jgi:outer membrane protein
MSVGRQSFDSENYEFRAEQPLFRFDRWLKLKQVDRRIAQAEAEVAAVHADLVMKVSERYLNVMGFRTDVKNSQAELEALLAQMDQTLVRYELGVATEADLLQAQADSDRAAAGVIKAQSNVDVAIDSIIELTDGPVVIVAELSDELLASPRSLVHSRC